MERYTDCTSDTGCLFRKPVTRQKIARGQRACQRLLSDWAHGKWGLGYGFNARAVVANAIRKIYFSELPSSEFHFC